MRMLAIMTKKNGIYGISISSIFFSMGCWLTHWNNCPKFSIYLEKRDYNTVRRKKTTRTCGHIKGYTDGSCW